VGGATVDSNPVTTRSFKGQVQQTYLPKYSEKSVIPWASHDTLFSMFFGINDVGGDYRTDDATLGSKIFDVYSSLVDELYQTGARNFLFLNVPPLDRSPWMTHGGPKWPGAPSYYQADIADFNLRLVEMANNFTRTYPDVTAFIFDTHAIFSRVLNDPCNYRQTCPLRNTTDYCEQYSMNTPSWYTFDPRCSVPVDQYFWINSAHPTFRIHNATAGAIAVGLSLLGASSNECGTFSQIVL